MLYSVLGLHIADWYNLYFAPEKTVNTPAQKINGNYDFIKNINDYGIYFNMYCAGTVKYQLDYRWTDDPNYINDCLVMWFKRQSHYLTLGKDAKDFEKFWSINDYYSQYFASLPETLWKTLPQININLSPFVLHEMLRAGWIPKSCISYLPPISDKDNTTISQRFVWKRFYNLKKIEGLKDKEEYQEALLENMKLYSHVVEKAKGQKAMSEDDYAKYEDVLKTIKEQNQEFREYLAQSKEFLEESAQKEIANLYNEKNLEEAIKQIHATNPQRNSTFQQIFQTLRKEDIKKIKEQVRVPLRSTVTGETVTVPDALALAKIEDQQQKMLSSIQPSRPKLRETLEELFKADHELYLEASKGTNTTIANVRAKLVAYNSVYDRWMLESGKLSTPGKGAVHREIRLPTSKVKVIQDLRYKTILISLVREKNIDTKISKKKNEVTLSLETIKESTKDIDLLQQGMDEEGDDFEEEEKQLTGENRVGKKVKLADLTNKTGALVSQVKELTAMVVESNETLKQEREQVLTPMIEEMKKHLNSEGGPANEDKKVGNVPTEIKIFEGEDYRSISQTEEVGANANRTFGYITFHFEPKFLLIDQWDGTFSRIPFKVYTLKKQ